MRNLTFCLIVLSTVALASVPTNAQQAQIGAAPSTLSVLYAGKPGSQRMADSKAFLEKHFAKVDTFNLETNFLAASDPYDVVVLDWPPMLMRDANGKVDMTQGSDANPVPKFRITTAWRKPAILIGGVAAEATRQMDTAIDWGCLCLDNYAHDMNLKHPIFQGPLPVKLDLVPLNKPFGYYLFPGTRKIGEQIQAWKVHDKSYPELDPGLVSSLERFTQTPDAEAISSGICDVGPQTVAIGRHGNFFLWGFAAAPSELTDSAKSVFINSICYMAAFNGKAAGAVATSSKMTRDDFLASLYILRQVSPIYTNALKAHYVELVKTTRLPSNLNLDPAEALKNRTTPMIQQLLESLPKSVREQTGDDVEKIIAYYTDNLEYLRVSSPHPWIVDEDVRSIGISNRDPRLLDHCVGLLERGENTELANRLLQLYTDQSFDSPQAWRKWYNDNQAHLHFDDPVGKFKIVP